MRLDAVTAEIRPRSDWEAVDLGLAMVRRDFWRCLALWWLAMLPVAVVGGWLWWDAALVWLAVFWWLKPLGSRMVLFEISRRLFGEKPAWRAALREIPRAWVRRFVYRLVWARLSPWLPVTLAVEDLEGLRGKAYRQRCGQVTRRGESVILWVYFLSDVAACWLGLAILVLLGMFIPEGQDGGWQLALETWNPDMPLDIPPVILRTVACCLMVAMSLTDVFVTGCGFGIYINNRTWLEGWDVELALRRMARRLSAAALPLVAACLFIAPPVCRAAEVEPAPAAERIRKLKAHPDFKVHTVKERVPKSKTPPRWLDWLSGLLRLGNLGWLGNLVIVSVIVLLLGLIAWLLWITRHVWRIRGGGPAGAPPPARARMVMGMEVSPESLPGDVPAAAWQLWSAGRRHEALGLLYRGAIAKAIDLGRAEIRESDTEGDCLRRVDAAAPATHAAYFRGLTRVWMGHAYAGRVPADDEVGALCRTWPFVEGGGG